MQTVLCDSYTYDVIFITKCFKSTELYIASGSAPPYEKFWVITCPHIINFNPLAPEFEHN